MEMGIDFGTTFSSVCFAPGMGVAGCVEESGTIFIPTAVGFRSDNTYTIGDGALLEEGLTVYRDIKRYFGLNKFNKDRILKKLNPTVEVIVGDWDCSIGPISNERGKAVSVVILAAYFVKACADLAVRACGKPVRISVCSVPAEYNSYMRSFIYNACAGSQIYIQAVVNEPTAAGLSSFVSIPKSSVKYLLVYDFGGGTFDCSLMVVGPAYVCVLDSLGDNFLGGRDVDEALKEQVTRILGLRKDDIDSFAMEALKIDLTSSKGSSVRRIILKNGEVKNFTYEVEDFVTLCSPFVRRARKIVEQIIARNKASEVVVVLIGGSSILPGVRESMATLPGVMKVLFDVKTYRAAVAIGAAIYAQSFSASTRYRLIDCVSSSLSDEQRPLRAICVFPKGHPVPASVVKKFTMPAYDTGAVLHEGENSNIRNNERTFSASIPKSSFNPGVTYDQVFSISEDGRLSATMGGKQLVNTVKVRSVAGADLTRKYISSDDRRIGPEVNRVKMFYNKHLKDSSYSTAATTQRKEKLKANGLNSE